MSDFIPAARLLDLLDPVLARVAALWPEDARDERAAASVHAALSTEFAPTSERVRAIGAEIARGIAEGWLCDRGEPDARFSRIAKPSEHTHGLSIDIVALRGPGMRHRHPQGEITLAFGDAASRFDGQPPGWIVLPAATVHTPTVTGATMHLLYFLPDGRVEWNVDA